MQIPLTRRLPLTRRIATFLKHLMNLHVGEVREGTESKRVKVHAPLPVDAKGHKPDYKKDDLGHGDINSSLWNGSHKYEHWLRLEGAVCHASACLGATVFDKTFVLARPSPTACQSWNIKIM